MVRPEDSDSSEGELESEEFQTGRWTAEEHERFLQGLREHNKQWKLIADLIRTRTVVQVRTHAQKHFQKMARLQAQTSRGSASAAPRGTRGDPESFTPEERAAFLSTAVSPPPAPRPADPRRRSRRTVAMAAAASAPPAAAVAAPSPKRRKSGPAASVYARRAQQQQKAYATRMRVATPPAPAPEADDEEAASSGGSDSETGSTSSGSTSSGGLQLDSLYTGHSAAAPRPSPTSVREVNFTLVSGEGAGSLSPGAVFEGFGVAETTPSLWLSPPLTRAPTDLKAAKLAPPPAAATVTPAATLSSAASYSSLQWLDAGDIADSSSATASVSSDGEGGWATDSEMGAAASGGLLDLELPFSSGMLDEDPVFGPSLPMTSAAAAAAAAPAATVGNKRPRSSSEDGDVAATAAAAAVAAAGIDSDLSCDPAFDLLSLEPLPLALAPQVSLAALAAPPLRRADAPAAFEEVEQDVDLFVRSLLHFPPAPSCMA